MRKTASLLLLTVPASACIWAEPVNPEPPSATGDVAPAIQSATPPGHDISDPYVDPNVPPSACEVSISLTIDSAASIQPLYAQIYLNDQLPTPSVRVDPGAPLLAEQSQNDPTVYSLGPVRINLADPQYAGALNNPSSEVANTITVFVSDGFADDTSPTPASGKYVTSWYWQLSFLSEGYLSHNPGSPCAQLFQ